MQAKRKLLISVLTTVMIFFAFTVVVSADTNIIDSGTSESGNWELTDDGELVIKLNSSSVSLNEIEVDYSKVNTVKFDCMDIRDSSYELFWNISGWSHSIPTIKFVGCKNKTFGEMSFSSFKDIQTIEISEGASFPEGITFSSCTFSSLDSIKTINSNRIRITFSDMSKVTIPDTYIADELHFEDCKFASNTLTLNATKNTYIAGQHSSIEKVEIKSTDANFHIFNLTDLTEVVFPKGLTNIQSYAFDTCSQLKSIELPSSLKKISSHAFYDCGMQSVKLPEGFEELEAYAFEDCQAMSYVVIPKSLTKIDKDAFSGCTALYRIYYTGTEEEWKQIKVLSSGNETDTDINTLFSNCRISFNYKTGWQQEYDQWVYYSESGIKVYDSWKKIDGSLYYFDTMGYMLTDWQKINGVWYYLGGSGAARIGWQKIGGTWYYFDDKGAMQTGWKQIDGTWYYFNGGGAMLSGWQLIGGTWYYFSGSGAMQTGWQLIGGQWYYLKPNGAMAANEYYGGYWLNSNGTWTYKHQAKWLRNSKGWYYTDDTGWYAKSGTYKIDGIDYAFNDSGYWIE